MRPQLLNSLFKPVLSLTGIGPKGAKLIESLAGKQVVDLLWHLPTGIIDRTYSPNLSNAVPGKIATIAITIQKHIAPKSRRLPYKIICSDDTGIISLIFFHHRNTYLRNILPEGEIRVVSGIIESYAGELQMAHPDQVGTYEELQRIRSVHPVYPLTSGLSYNVLSKTIRNIIETLPELPEWHDNSYLKKNKWPSWKQALIDVHMPTSEYDISSSSSARLRLALDQLLANQLALSLVRKQLRGKSGRSIPTSNNLGSSIKEALPFDLTKSQLSAIEEINKDISSVHRMHRLLQGDVGSGKTIVALLGMANTIEAGYQVALLAPTEILARQHFATIKPFADIVNLVVEGFTGRDKGSTRESILSKLKNGQTQLIIGTHALLQDDVKFKNLALVVIDEQHRFGVHQRLALSEKGNLVDLLVMTATPIPRTLTLTAYGDMDTTRLTEKPTNYLPIDTRAIPTERMPEITEAIGRALSKGANVYWICPLIQESEASDLVAAEDRYRYLRKLFGSRVGLLHGKMKGTQKDDIIQKFSNQNINILVSTTVVEVGIHIPKATVMVIEQAERFGLAQLHQLRGRIGRGQGKSTCLLLYSKSISEISRERINVIREIDDGFQIAEHDLRLRGTGDLLGTRQSGIPALKLVDMQEHNNLIQAARNYADLILEKDPNLKTDIGKNLRLLLYLFEQDSGAKLLKNA